MNPFQYQLENNPPLTRELWEDINSRTAESLAVDRIGKRMLFAMVSRNGNMQIERIFEDEADDFLSKHKYLGTPPGRKGGGMKCPCFEAQ